LNTSRRQKQRWDGWNSFLNFDDPCHMYDGKKTLQTCLRSLYEKHPNNIRIKNGNMICNYCGFFLVHKDRILSHDINFYIELNNDLKKNKLVGYALERLWTPLFYPEVNPSSLPTLSNIKTSRTVEIDKGIDCRFYLIHNGDPQRRSFMNAQFSKHGIDTNKVVWIEYPNKSDVTDDLHNKVSLSPSTHTKGQTCVTYKQYIAIKDLYYNDSELGVIMEDNIEFHGNVIEAIKRYIANMDDNWNILFDSDILSDSYKRFNPPPSSTGVILSNGCGPSKGANFVLINRNCYQKLYDSYLPYKMHSDHNYNQVIKEQKLKSYWAVPYNVHYRNLKSSWT
jgi:hypothetical protein